MKANKRLDPNNPNHWITHAEYMKRKSRSTAKQKLERFTTWHYEMLIAACLGAALALSVVVAVGMLTTEWVW